MKDIQAVTLGQPVGWFSDTSEMTVYNILGIVTPGQDNQKVTAVANQHIGKI